LFHNKPPVFSELAYVIRIAQNFEKLLNKLRLNHNKFSLNATYFHSNSGLLQSEIGTFFQAQASISP